MSLPELKGPFTMFASKKGPAKHVVKKNTPAPPISITETTGMPPGWSARLHSHLALEAHKRSVPLSQSLTVQNDLKLVGHFSAAEVTEGTLVAYVWDVKNKKGENIHRVSGQKRVPRKGPRGAWSALSDETLRSVGEDAAKDLHNWLKSSGYVLQPVQLAESVEPEPAAPPKIEVKKPQQQKKPVMRTKKKPLAMPRIKQAKKQPEKKVKTAGLNTAPLPAPQKETGFNKEQEHARTIKPSPVPQKTVTQKTPPVSKPASTSFVYVSSVDGARGQGNSELTRAIISSLAKNGLGISPRPGPAGYKLEGKVKIEPSDDGKDRVFLSWNIKTADGTLIGTVSQKNKIQSGSFDRTWGQTAFFAADAAAGSIKTVIDKQQGQKI